MNDKKREREREHSKDLKIQLHAIKTFMRTDYYFMRGNTREISLRERERERAASFVTISFFPLPVSSLDISLSRNLVSLSKGFLSSRLVNVPR